MSSIRSTFRLLVHPVDIQPTAARSSMASLGSGPEDRSRSSTYCRNDPLAASHSRAYVPAGYARIIALWIG
jgi:hypothetical protein